jgi:non-specific serine/threonine protein kinase/serine/threonine-protein kinase
VTPERWRQIKPLLASALDCPPAERAALLAAACASDGALQAEVESLLAAHDAAGSFLDTPAMAAPGRGAQLDASRAGLRIGPYELIRELGRGGMGVVYLAARADHAFDKQVAIKLVRGLFADAYVAERFRDERQILANLNHPCVAHLFDGGTTDEGAPYLVMEYVEGMPIDEYCKRHAVDTPRRLDLFRQVCDAVHYAHRNLVIHRDLKPSNILVTADGTPKLLDFGIAKLTRTDVVATETLRSFTPEYASPEQVRGDPITTGSDVYALGVLLYVLLTGRTPYRATDDPLAQARMICEDAPIPPGTAAHDLDTIVLKALRKEPERRYSSVEQLSTDIARFLGGLPVLAAPDTLRYHAAKFVRRHTLGVASAATLFLVLAGATAVTTWQARVANRERARAERRFNEVRQLATSVVGELHDAIRDLSGATPARKLLVTRAIEYLDRLASEAAGDASLQRELAGAYAKMGDAQGNPYLANLGDRAGAMRSYQRAFEMHRAIAAAFPADPAAQQDVAADHMRIADMLWADARYADALPRYRESMAISERLAAEDAARFEDRFNVTRSLNRMGQLQMNAGDLPAALKLYQQSKALTADLSAAAPDNVAYRRGFAVAALKIGDVADRLNDFPGAFNGYVEAERIARQLSLENPASADLRRTFALALGRLAIGYLKVQRAGDAATTSREALNVYRALAAADPENVQTQLDMADTYGGLGDALNAQGHVSEAADAIRHALRFTRTSADMPPVAGTSRTCTYRWVPCCAIPIRLEHWTPIGRPPACLRWSRFAASIRRSSRRATPVFVTRRPDSPRPRRGGRRRATGRSSSTGLAFLQLLAHLLPDLRHGIFDRFHHFVLRRVVRSGHVHRRLRHHREGRAMPD